MRIEPGPHSHTSTSGMVVSVDRPLSQEQVDLLVQVIERAGQQPNTTHAIELSEAGIYIELIDTGIVDVGPGWTRHRVRVS